MAAAATLVATAFALCTLERWLDGRSRHQAAWTVSLAMFVVAAGALFWGFTTGWNSANFRLFYLFGAILNVPWLALGTVHLLAPKAVATRVQQGLVLLTPFCAGVLLATPLKAAVPSSGIPEGREIFGVGPRVMAAVGSGVAATVVLIGAGWSAWRWFRAWRTRDPSIDRSAAWRLAVTNGCIAIGTLVLGSGGSFAGSGNRETGFALSLLVGIALLFGGFLVSTRRGTTPTQRPFMQELRALALPQHSPQQLPTEVLGD